MRSGNNHLTRGGSTTFCPECSALVEVALVPPDQTFTCGQCGCRFQIGPLPDGYAYGPQVEAHGDRWRRIRVVPHAQMSREVGCLGVGWERVGRGLELYLGLGPLTLSLYVGPGLARG